MGKGFAILIILVLLFGLFYYFEPEKAKEFIVGSTIKGRDMLNSIKDKLPTNLGQITKPCTSNDECNININDCEGNCTCVDGDCIKNK